MENTPIPTPAASSQKQPLFDGKVAGLGFVVLAILLFILPEILVALIPSAFIGTSKIPYLLEGSFAFASLVIGFLVGLKAKHRPFVSALITGIVTLLFFEFALIPSSRIGLTSLMQYGLILLLPIVVGALIGKIIHKRKTQ